MNITSTANNNLKMILADMEKTKEEKELLANILESIPGERGLFQDQEQKTKEDILEIQ